MQRYSFTSVKQRCSLYALRVSIPARHRRKTYFTALFLAVYPLLLLTGGFTFAKGEHAHLTWENRDREYRVHVPPSYDATKPVPLVVALHGAGMTPLLMAWLTGFNRIADREGFIVVYPKGLHKRWSSGVNLPGFPGYETPVDDVGLIGRIMDQMERDYRIDPRRIYVTGASNGGMLTHLVACRFSRRIAAAAPVIGTISEKSLPECKPEAPVPILMVNGTEDPIVLWKGGPLFKEEKARILPIRAVVDFWVGRNGCNPGPETAQLLHHGSQCGTRTQVERYHGPTPRSDVVLYAVERGGHTWPGGPLIQNQLRLGRVSRDFKAAEVIWQFFKEHPRAE